MNLWQHFHLNGIIRNSRTNSIGALFYKPTKTLILSYQDISFDLYHENMTIICDGHTIFIYDKENEICALLKKHPYLPKLQLILPDIT